MSRNERDWNRRIPERQAPRAEASRLLRSVASEHIPEPPSPAPWVTDGWAMPSVTTSTLNTRSLGSLMRQSNATDSATDSAYTRALFDGYLFRDAITQTGRNPNRNQYMGDFDSHMADRIRSDLLESTRSQTENVTRTVSTGWGTATVNGRGGGGGGNTGRSGAGVAPPLQQIARNPMSSMSYTLQARSEAQYMNMAYAVPGDLEFDHVRANSLTEDLRIRVEEETRRMLRDGLNNISRELNMTNTMSQVNPRFNTDVRIHGQGYSYDNNLVSGTTVGNGSTGNQGNTLEEIKAWIKGALEIRTEVSEEDGSLSVKTTVLFEGEEISSDSDFVNISNPNTNDF